MEISGYDAFIPGELPVIGEILSRNGIEETAVVKINGLGGKDTVSNIG
jgi:hypothetical protein